MRVDGRVASVQAVLDLVAAAVGGNGLRRYAQVVLGETEDL